MKALEYSGGSISTGFQPEYVEINRHSSAYSRMTKAGFTINKPMIIDNQLVGSFTCICGKKEWYITSLKALPDVALTIENLGAISAKHLLEDGYSKEQIIAIRKVYV